jgi:hypothetical protein
VKKGIIECFPTLHDFVAESETPLNPEIASEMIEHLKNLQVSIKQYFPPAKEGMSWLRNPFSASIEDLDLPVRKIEQLIDIAADRNLIATFKPATLFKFWTQPRSEYPEVAKHAVKKLLPFASTYRCEVAFSKYTLTKTKQRSRLDPEADMRLQLSNIKLDFKELISGRQAHQYHKKNTFR